MKPRWQKLEQQNPWLKSTYYDFDQDKDIVTKYHIQSGTLPTFIFLDKKNKEFLRLTGEYKADKLQQVLDKYKDK